MKSASEQEFKENYQSHLKHLKLKGLQPKTIEAYSRAIRRVGAYFDYSDRRSLRAATDRPLHRSPGRVPGRRGV